MEKSARGLSDEESLEAKNKNQTEGRGQPIPSSINRDESRSAIPSFTTIPLSQSANARMIPICSACSSTSCSCSEKLTTRLLPDHTQGSKMTKNPTTATTNMNDNTKHENEGATPKKDQRNQDDHYQIDKPTNEETDKDDERETVKRSPDLLATSATGGSSANTQDTSNESPKSRISSFLLGIGKNIQNLDGVDLAAFVRENESTLSFPEKLMLMLARVEILKEKGLLADDPPCICWSPDGHSFVIHNKGALVNELLPAFFPKSSKYASFTRKLYRWGFRQIPSNRFAHGTHSPTRRVRSLSLGGEPGESGEALQVPPVTTRGDMVVSGDNCSAEGSSNREMMFCHDCFQRDNRLLMSRMRSVTAAGTRRALAAMAVRQQKKLLEEHYRQQWSMYQMIGHQNQFLNLIPRQQQGEGGSATPQGNSTGGVTGSVATTTTFGPSQHQGLALPVPGGHKHSGGAGATSGLGAAAPSSATTRMGVAAALSAAASVIGNDNRTMPITQTHASREGGGSTMVLSPSFSQQKLPASQVTMTTHPPSSSSGGGGQQDHQEQPVGAAGGGGAPPSLAAPSPRQLPVSSGTASSESTSTPQQNVASAVATIQPQVPFLHPQPAARPSPGQQQAPGVRQQQSQMMNVGGSHHYATAAPGTPAMGAPPGYPQHQQMQIGGGAAAQPTSFNLVQQQQQLSVDHQIALIMSVAQSMFVGAGAAAPVGAGVALSKPVPNYYQHANQVQPSLTTDSGSSATAVTTTAPGGTNTTPSNRPASAAAAATTAATAASPVPAFAVNQETLARTSAAAQSVRSSQNRPSSAPPVGAIIPTVTLQAQQVKVPNPPLLQHQQVQQPSIRPQAHLPAMGIEHFFQQQQQQQAWQNFQAQQQQNWNQFLLSSLAQQQQQQQQQQAPPTPMMVAAAPVQQEQQQHQLPAAISVTGALLPQQQQIIVASEQGGQQDHRQKSRGFQQEQQRDGKQHETIHQKDDTVGEMGSFSTSPAHSWSSGEDNQDAEGEGGGNPKG